MRFVLSNVRETELLAKVMSRHLSGGDLLVLSGELGTGKTVFSRGLLSALGVKDEVTSPTFVLMKSYLGVIPIDHVDIYRVNDPDELDILCIGELLAEEHLVMVEWGEKAIGLLGDSYLQLTFERLEDETSLEAEIAGEARRMVTLDTVGAKMARRRSKIGMEIAQVWNAF